ncbi:hypothetical protein F5880DRAFT_1701668 [Lentinula raphanica]|nr:hypothetical protein F5880DRAFT_1701668 [Lentinula raphanica]
MKRTLRSDSRKVDSFSVERQHVPPTPVFTATVMEDYRRRLKEAIKTKRLIHFLPGYGMVDFALPLKNDGTMVPIEQKALENYRRTHEFRFPSCLHASNTGMYSETVIRSRRGVLAFACNVKGNFCAYYVPIATLLGAESQVEFEEYDVKTYLGSISTMSALSSPPSAPPDAPQPSTQSISVSMQSPPDSLPQLLSPLEHLPPLLQLPELAPSARSVLLSQPSSEMSFSSQHVEPSFSSQQIESSTASEQVESLTASEQVESSTASEQVESSTALEQIEASAYSTRVEASAYSTRVEASASPPWVQLHSLLHNMEHSSAGPSTSLQRLHSFLLAHTLRSSQSPDSAVSTQSSPISPSLRHLPVTPPPPPPHLENYIGPGLSSSQANKDLGGVPVESQRPEANGCFPDAPPSQPGSSSRFLDDNHKGKKRAQAPEPLVSTKRIKRFPYQKAVRDRSLSALNATSSTTVATTMVSSNLVFTPIDICKVITTSLKHPLPYNKEWVTCLQSLGLNETTIHIHNQEDCPPNDFISIVDHSFNALWICLRTRGLDSDQLKILFRRCSACTKYVHYDYTDSHDLHCEPPQVLIISDSE